LNVFVPRSLLLRQLRSHRTLHSSRLSVDSALGRIFTAFLTATAEELPRATQAEIPAIAESIIGTIAVLLDSVAMASDPSSLLDEPTQRAMRDYIELNLQDPDFNVDSVHLAFRCSRAHAYRLFREYEGIASYIQNAHLSVSEIAFKWGFSSHSNLCRRFRDLYQMSPSEARNLARSEGEVATVGQGAHAVESRAPRYRDWLVRLADRKDG